MFDNENPTGRGLPIHEEEEERYAQEGYTLDEIAKKFASGNLSRGQALKLIGASIFGSVLGSTTLGMFPELASAKKKGRGRHKKHKKPKTITTLPPGQTCNSTNCADGCCVNNTCHTNDPQLCGTGGGNCVQCQQGVACASGVCQTGPPPPGPPPPGPPPPSCDSSNCQHGCCSGTACLVGNPQFCGTGGSNCINCGTAVGISCVNGACVQPPPSTCGPTNLSGSCPTGQRCVSGACVCDATSCPHGCCVNGECHVYDPQACGTGGGFCHSCPPGLACFSGKCVREPVTACTATCSDPACFGYCMQTIEGDLLCACSGVYSNIPCFSSANCTDPIFPFCVTRTDRNAPCFGNFGPGGDYLCASSC